MLSGDLLGNHNIAIMKAGLSFKQKYGFLSVLAIAMTLAGFPTSSVNLWLVLAVLWLFLGGHRTLYLAYHTFGRDFRFATLSTKSSGVI